MPNIYSNFSNPDLGSASGGAGTTARPTGTGDNGETWDPVQNRWIPRGQMPATNTPGTITDPGNDTNSQGQQSGSPFASGRVMGAGAWGGYAGTNVVGPDGNLIYDQSLNGANADTQRYQGMGAAAAQRGAYQNDYTTANRDAADAANMRASQDTALGMAHMTALHGNYQSQQLGQHMLAQGVQAQQAAALSARGGGLAQAVALRNQQVGQAAYMQQGNNALAAQQADDMAAGRSLYQQQAGAQRAGDATAQGLHQEQATAQASSELGQRQLNDQTQQGYEGLGQDVQHAQQQGALKSEQTDAGIFNTTSQNDQANHDRDMKIVGAGVGSVGTLIGGVTHSDARTKQGVRPMGLGAAVLAGKGRY